MNSKLLSQFVAQREWGGYFKASFFILFFTSSVCHASPWPEHQENIHRIERGLQKFQEELDQQVEVKKKTRDRARIEETLQRIVEIHSELITLRKELDSERRHINSEHPAQAGILDNFDKRKPVAKKKRAFSPLGSKLDSLLIKVRLKFATFMKEEKKPEMVEVEKVVKVKKRLKKEREADVYLRRKSKVKLTK